jgi:prophage antirepressor-like protein
MSNIQIFNNPDFGTVRTLDNDGTVLFCGADIAKALGYSNPSKALNDHCKGDLTKRYPITDSLGRTQDAIFIPESDLYRLVFGSKLPSAEKFTDWVTETVLPSIRKHGAYMTPETLQAAILNPDTMIQLCQQLKIEQDKNKALSEENAKLAPKGLFADAVSVSDRCILVSGLAKLLKQNGIETGQNRLYEQLRADGFLVKDRKRSDFNMPTQKAMEWGCLRCANLPEYTLTDTQLLIRRPKSPGKARFILSITILRSSKTN